jgi:stage III sporulation protein AF
MDLTGALTDWIRNLISLIFLFMLLEAILPQGNKGGVVQVVMGLVLIAFFLNPMFHLLGLGMDWDLLVLSTEHGYEDYLEAGTRLAERAKTRLVSEYGSQTHEQLRHFLLVLPGVTDAQVNWIEHGRGMERIVVDLWGVNQEELVTPVVINIGGDQPQAPQVNSNQIRQLISDFCGLQQENIEINYRGE